MTKERLFSQLAKYVERNGNAKCPLDDIGEARKLLNLVEVVVTEHVQHWNPAQCPECAALKPFH